MVALMICLLVGGCIPKSHIVFINNSGKNLTLNSRGENHYLTNGLAIEIKWPGEDQLITIDTGLKKSWVYRVTIFNNPFVKDRRAYMQIEPDGLIYIMPPGTLTPVKNIPPQPVNFPWKPLENL